MQIEMATGVYRGLEGLGIATIRGQFWGVPKQGL